MPARLLDKPDRIGRPEPATLPDIHEMDEIEREAIRDEGYDPDDPAVVKATDFVRWELSILGR